MSISSLKKGTLSLLSCEIKQFVKFVAPTPHERLLRRDAKLRVIAAIHNATPRTAKVKQFGSSSTQLCMSTSDTDLAVINTTTTDVKPGKNPHNHTKGDIRNLYRAYEGLKNSPCFTQVQKLPFAKVLLVKAVDKTSGLQFDISFGIATGVAAVEDIRKWVSTTPGLKELIMVLKQFLKENKLNDPFLGGFGSFTVTCMAYTFLKLRPDLESSSGVSVRDEEIGKSLIEFFRYYSDTFDYAKQGIFFKKENVDGDVILVPFIDDKSKFEGERKNDFETCLVIVDPRNPLNNVSRVSRKIEELKKLMNDAYTILLETGLQVQNEKGITDNKVYSLNKENIIESRPETAHTGSKILNPSLPYLNLMRNARSQEQGQKQVQLESRTEERNAELGSKIIDSEQEKKEKNTPKVIDLPQQSILKSIISFNTRTELMGEPSQPPSQRNHGKRRQGFSNRKEDKSPKQI